MSKKQKPPLFYRSFFLTLGAVGLLLPVIIWITDGSHSNSWPLKAWIILFFLLVSGLCFLLFGIFASDKKIDSTRIVATFDTLLMAALATPLYFILRGMQRRKREQLSHKKYGKKHGRVA